MHIHALSEPKQHKLKGVLPYLSGHLVKDERCPTLWRLCDVRVVATMKRFLAVRPGKEGNRQQTQLESQPHVDGFSSPNSWIGRRARSLWLMYHRRRVCDPAHSNAFHNFCFNPTVLCWFIDRPMVYLREYSFVKRTRRCCFPLFCICKEDMLRSVTRSHQFVPYTRFW